MYVFLYVWSYSYRNSSQKVNRWCNFNMSCKDEEEKRIFRQRHHICTVRSYITIRIDLLIHWSYLFMEQLSTLYYQSYIYGYIIVHSDWNFTIFNTCSDVCVWHKVVQWNRMNTSFPSVLSPFVKVMKGVVPFMCERSPLLHQQNLLWIHSHIQVTERHDSWNFR